MKNEFAARRSGLSKHTHPRRGEYDTWLTPRVILWGLGDFDLDPCAAPEPRPWPTAAKHYVVSDDGLRKPWEGRVWLNPPYGDDVAVWMGRMAEHRSGIALTFARTETEWWKRYVWPAATALLFIYGRLNFCYPDGSVSQYNSGGPSVLISYSVHDARVLQCCGIRGALVRVEGV